MAEINPMYNMVNTILDDKEIVIFLGAGASMEGTQNEERFPGFDDLIDRILNRFGFDPLQKKERFNNFLTVIKKWEKEKKLSASLLKYLDGEPGLAHYFLAILSIALVGESNAMLYLTTNYDDLMKKAFTDLERNPIKKFNTVALSLRPRITGSEFQEIMGNIELHLKRGRPVILKLFGDLNSQCPIFRQEDMVFEPEVERKLLEWMKKPMIVIGYSFSDKIIEKLLIASRGSSSIFLVNPSKKDIPSSINNLDGVYHIKMNFSQFIQDLFKMLKEENPPISKKFDKIIEFLSSLPGRPDLQATQNIFKSDDSSKSKHKIDEIDKEPQEHINPVKKILILSINPKATSILRFDEETREIRESLLHAKHRNRFETHSKLAVRLKGVRKALSDYEPQIVHLIGHGNEDGLQVKDKQGNPALISSKTLSRLFKLCSDQLECVIITSNYSASQATAISEHIDYVIGMADKIPDKAAIEFAVGFYDALGAGRSVEDAFDLGCNAIMHVFPDLPLHYIPVLKKKKELEKQDSNEIRGETEKCMTEIDAKTLEQSSVEYLEDELRNAVSKELNSDRKKYLQKTIRISSEREDRLKNVESNNSLTPNRKMEKSHSQFREPSDHMKPVKKILILSANPKVTSRLRFDEEIRNIEEGLWRSKRREKFEIKSRMAVRFRDLRRVLLTYEPHIVHFAGHGKEDGLEIEDELGYPVLISSKVLSNLFRLCSGQIECVILNACCSQSQANAISEHIDYVIGMGDKIMDNTAIEFAVGFYDALGAGRSVEDAFDFGCNAIMQVFPDLHLHYIPVLKKKEDAEK